MEYWFTVREQDGQVDAHVPEELRLLNHALADSISSLPPRGAPGHGPSTYWIDAARAGVLEAIDSGSDEPFLSGNITTLTVTGDVVKAQYDFDDEDAPGETIAVSEFLALLDGWASRVQSQAQSVTYRLPETYRRNPQT